MNKHIQTGIVATAIAATLSFTSCDSAPKGDAAKVTEEQKTTTTATGQQYMVDTAASYIRFTGYGVGKNHPGRFHMTAGNMTASNNQVTGGDFTININSLDLEQKDEMFQSKLRPHLMSPDFFDAAKYGTAKFAITKVEPYTASTTDTSVVKGANFNVSGNLTLKETTRNVTFPAKIEADGNTLKATANFNIDRTQWNMNYGNDKGLGNKAISPSVNIEFDITAKKN